MPFKMVPVPADHVYDVMRFLLARQDEEAARRDRERLSQLLTEDDFTGALLTLVANQTIDGEPSRVRDVATELGTDDETVIAAVRAMNKQAIEAGFERVLKMGESTFLTADGKYWNSIVVKMAPELAVTVADLAAPTEDASP